jgi:hypothetical protein
VAGTESVIVEFVIVREVLVVAMIRDTKLVIVEFIITGEVPVIVII